ncbi:MAG: polymer-forming cytoskeletal protein [Alphaproteobacteria bacterium]|nr:polymer-forming cytoskeletal protein [Alphaproteobacteria bacterium]
MLASPRRTLVKPPSARGGPRPSSRVGKALTVTGVIDSDGEVCVEGNVLGQVNVDRLVVGSGGYVEGDVVAREVRVEGRLRGRVFAFNVTLDASADVIGRIFHHTVTVAKGARIDGRMPWRPVNFFESFEQPPEDQT